MAATAVLAHPAPTHLVPVRTTGTHRGVPSAPHPLGYRAAPSPAGPARASAAAARRRSEAAARARRRRLLAGAAALAVVLVLGRAGVASGGAESGAADSVPVGSVQVAEPVVRVVEPGDTLWAIARDLAPGRDPRAVVDDLVRARGGRADLVPGERIVWLAR